MKNRTKQRYGRLLVLEPTDRRGSGGNVIWKCLCDCGKTCYVDSIHLNPHGQKSCGCLQKENVSKRMKATGPESNRWIKDRSKVKTGLGRNGQRDAVWRKAVYKQDDYTCQMCNSKKNIQAHHIDNYKDFAKQRLEVLNGITLCTRCHKLFHSLYGRKGTTSIHLAEFLIGEV